MTNIINPNFEDETTGRYIVVFRDDATTAGLDFLRSSCGVNNVASAADFANSAVDPNQVSDADGILLPTLGIMVVSNIDSNALNQIRQNVASNSSILSVEPERIFYANSAQPSSDYFHGFADAAVYLRDKFGNSQEQVESLQSTAPPFFDDASSTWGLKATDVINSGFTGRGIKVAVLDTGMDLGHPDFSGRAITSASFIPNESVDDLNGHGTHCIGTACGGTDLNGRRYGVASEATIFAGKVLNNDPGSGPTGGIIEGIEWAINNDCEIISLSLGNRFPFSETDYETVGLRALREGSLIVASAGNHRIRGNSIPPRFPGTVGQPGNSPSIMAVAAVDNTLRLGSFSVTSGSGFGANVDIAAPGVNVYSSLPTVSSVIGRRLGGVTRYGSINGTSMAAPHVAGIAALYAEATGERGDSLWRALTSRASRLSLPNADVGSGLVQA
ncbi:MAG: S8 family serine peptidase [Xenococcus sp. MO_188.B8]|nr:S8 family serine peptidase [Xenococcus sp. MO_188.B8]